MTHERWQLLPQPAPSGPWPWWPPGTSAALRWLREHGCAHARVALGLDNCPASVAVLCAAPLLGCTIILLNRRLPSAELSQQIEHAAATRLCAHAAHPASALQHALRLPSVFADDDGDSTLDCPAPDDEHVTAILFTSGTTGTAKAACLSWRAIRHAVLASCATLSLGPQQRWLAVLPLDHIGGAMIAWRSAWSGCCLDLHARWDTARVAMALPDVSGASLVPTQLHRLIEARGDQPWPASVRTLLVGGGPLAPTLAQRCAALGCTPRQTYGLTEAAAMVCVQAGSASPDGGCGVPLPGMELRIAADQRIEIRGPALFSGYVGGAAIDPTHWWSTGDLGSVRDDGQLLVLCRRDDLILSGGENCYPAQIEALLCRHPSIAEACVVGIPDAEWGQRIAAMLVARNQPIADDALRAWMQIHLGHRQPRRWQWTNALPSTANGKIDRRAVRAAFAVPAAPADLA